MNLILTLPSPSSTCLLSPLPTLKAPFCIYGAFIQRRKFHGWAKPITEKLHISAHKDDRNVQVADFVETVQNLEAFDKLLRKGDVRSISKFNQLLKSLISEDEFELAVKLASSLSSFELLPDNATYSILVNCYCKKNEPAQAKSTLEHMLGIGFVPDVATFTILINSFGENGRLKDAFEVFDTMSRVGCEPTINTYNCLLKGLCYVGRIEEAYNLMRSINKSNIKLDIYTYTAMMNGFCKVGRTIEAYELLDEALKMGLEPNVVTYNTLFNGYFKQGKPMRGFSVLKRMREANCEPDYISYSTMMHGLLKWRKTGPAYRMYMEMVENGYSLDERMMNTLLRGLCRRSRKENSLLKDVYSLFEEMNHKNYTIDPCAYDLVVEAFCRGREMDSVLEILIHMMSIGHSPKAFTFNVVIYTLCGVGEVDKALTVLMLMHKARKYQGTGTPFSALIKEMNLQGRFLEACIVYGMALRRGVAPKRKPSKYVAEQVKSKGVTMTALLVKATVTALVEHPVLNSSCRDGKSFTYNPHINIAVAVAIDGGLITPVLQDADKILPLLNSCPTLNNYYYFHYASISFLRMTSHCICLMLTYIHYQENGRSWLIKNELSNSNPMHTL